MNKSKEYEKKKIKSEKEHRDMIQNGNGRKPIKWKDFESHLISGPEYLG